MKKILFLTIVTCVVSLTANAQVATPYLDASAHSTGPAAAGWRYASVVSGYAASVSSSKVTSNANAVGDEIEIGEIKKSAAMPPITAAYRGENLGAEFYYSSGVATEVDAEWNFAALLPDWQSNTVETEDNMRINLAWVFGEVLSLGFGYWTEKVELTEDSTFYVPPSDLPPPLNLLITDPYASVTTDSTFTTNRTVTSLMVSWRLMDMIYLAGGIENEAQTIEASGTQTFASATFPASASSLSTTFVDNSWSNTVLGIGVVVGAPEESQFRAEYAINKSPESKKDASGGDAAFYHPETDTTYASLEAKFGQILVTYRMVKEEQKEIDNNEVEVVDENTTTGVGWMPLEGISVMAYMETSKKTTKEGSSKSVLEGNGYGLSVSWLF